MKKLIVIIMLILPLAGCLPAVFVIGATAGGAAIYDRRGVKLKVQDHNAEVTAQNRINRDKVLKGRSHISVIVFNHVALMVGQAETPELKQRAYQWVASVPNISRIYNEVRVSGPTAFLTRSEDTWITTKVKTAMLTEKGLKSTLIKIVTENGVVYMMGLVNKQQASLATNVARRVSGVRKVVKVFQYAPKVK